MLITRTPLRVSFFGGGTDYPSWYNSHGGSVISTTIDKFSYITCRYLPHFFDYKYLIKYSKIEKVSSLSEIQHPSVRECLKFLDIQKGVEMAYSSDVPAMSGLGSSSSFTVGFLQALYALEGKMSTKRQLALNAIEVEQEKIKENVGSQDQTAAAYGGFNKITFGGPDKITVTPLTIKAAKLQALQSHLMLFFTGISRQASEIAKEQIKNSQNKKIEHAKLADLTAEAEKILSSPAEDLTDFGKLLAESWRVKRGLSSLISSPFIDSLYETAKQAGAIGGKLLGAGGGGFILLFVNPEKQALVKEKLKNLVYVPFAFEFLGSQVIYYDPTSNF